MNVINADVTNLARKLIFISRPKSRFQISVYYVVTSFIQ